MSSQPATPTRRHRRPVDFDPRLSGKTTARHGELTPEMFAAIRRRGEVVIEIEEDDELVIFGTCRPLDSQPIVTLESVWISPDHLDRAAELVKTIMDATIEETGKPVAVGQAACEVGDILAQFCDAYPGDLYVYAP